MHDIIKRVIIRQNEARDEVDRKLENIILPKDYKYLEDMFGARYAKMYYLVMEAGK